MNKIISVLAIVIGIAGCASSSPEATVQSSATKAVATDATTESVAAVSSTDATSSSGELEFMDSPEVEKVASAEARREEMICKRIQITGSHRMEKVCRPRYEVEETMRNAQEAVRKLERNAAKSASN